MALPKVQAADIVEVVFHNHDKMYRYQDVLYASAKNSEASEIDMECEGHFILMGGEARVESADRSAILLGATTTTSGDGIEEEDIAHIRVERKFIKSLKVTSRFTTVTFGDECIEVRVPEDPEDHLEIFQEGSLEDEFRPKAVRDFLKEVKTRYYDTKVKAKSKKKKPGTMKKGTKINEGNWQTGMSLDVKAIPWLKADDDLGAIQLHFVWNEGYFGVDVQFDCGDLKVYHSDTYTWRVLPEHLIASITLSKGFTPAKWREEEEEPDHAEFGDLIFEKEIGYTSMTFYDRGIEVGCKGFAVADVKKLYKTLCKVYGEPK